MGTAEEERESNTMASTSLIDLISYDIFLNNQRIELKKNGKKER